MDTETLVSDKYDVGKRLIIIMDAQELKYPVIFWMLQDELNGWVLVFGVPKLKALGAKKIYKKINDIIVSRNLEIDLDSIKLLDTRDSLILTLRSMISTDRKLAEISITNSFYNGSKFPNSIVYRVWKTNLA